MRMYVNQAGYLPGEKKTILLAEAAEEEISKLQSGKYPPETVKVIPRCIYK